MTPCRCACGCQQMVTRAEGERTKRCLTCRHTPGPDCRRLPLDPRRGASVTRTCNCACGHAVPFVTGAVSAVARCADCRHEPGETCGRTYTRKPETAATTRRRPKTLLTDRTCACGCGCRQAFKEPASYYTVRCRRCRWGAAPSCARKIPERQTARKRDDVAADVLDAYFAAKDAAKRARRWSAS